MVMAMFLSFVFIVFLLIRLRLQSLVSGMQP